MATNNNENKSILYLHKYSRMAAAYRYRFELFFRYVEEKSLSIEKQSLLGDNYLQHMYSKGRRPWLTVALSYITRFIFLLCQPSKKLKVVYMELFPRLPYFIEKIFLKPRTYILELDDAYFLAYDSGPLKQKVPKLMKNASAIIAGSHYLKAYAEKWNHNVHLVPTVVDLKDYPEPKQHQETEAVTIGWMGSPSTSKELLLLEKSFKKLDQKFNIKFLFVGSPDLDINLNNVEYRNWQEEKVISDILDMDIGIMPLENDEWNKGKCGFKLIQYMAAGIPVVTSKVGENTYIVQNGEQGFYADTDEQWVVSLSKLVESVALRQTMGGKAAQKIKDHYSLESVSKSYVELIENCL